MADGETTELAWRKSSYTQPHDCVETAVAEGVILVRDSKRAPGPVLAFTVAAWDGFLGGVVTGTAGPARP